MFCTVPRKIGIPLLLAALSSAAAATPATVNLTCAPPTTRIDGSLLGATDLGPYHFLLNNTELANTSPTCSMTYSVPAGTCVKATDTWNVYATDTSGLKSPLSNTVSTGVDACTPKPVPNPPGSVKITVTPAS